VKILMTLLAALLGSAPLLAQLEPELVVAMTDTTPRKAVLGDWDGDGHNELAVGSYSSESLAHVKVYRWQDGELVQLLKLNHNAHSAYPLFADADNDGELELIVSTDRGDSGGGVYIYDFNDWTQPTLLWSASFGTIRRERGVSVGDVDNDGLNELCIGVDWYGRRLYVYEHVGGTWINSWSVGGNDFRSTFVGDADNDGLNELVVGCGNWSWYDWRVYKGPQGNYSLQWDSGHYGSATAIVGDPDGDGLNEVVIASSANQGGRNDLTICRWNGQTYAEVWRWNAGVATHGPALGDLLGNGQQQIACFSGVQYGGAPGDSCVHVFSFDGTAATEIWRSESLESPWHGDCLIGDLDHDGDGELIVCHYQSGLFVWDFTPGEDEVVGAADPPKSFGLLQAWPNPFNPVTRLAFELPETDHARLRIFDLTGREVASLVNGLLERGHHEVQWNAAGSASGLYLAVLESSGQVGTQRLLLIK
jgi:hypothetical protein